MNILKLQIKDYLNSHESAPGAHAFVLSVIREVTDDELSQIYEQSEGYNDAERDALINTLTSDQLMTLAAYILEMANEKLEELEGQVI